MSDSVKMKNLRGLIACFVFSGVYGCGGDDSTAPTENASSISSSSDESVNANDGIINEASVQAVRGRFIGSAVDGLAYASDDLVGFTDVEGRFEYRDERAIEFSIGGITLGKALGDATMTPVTIVAGAVDEQHPVVTNIARFLQTLDDDGDPANGISITPGVTELAVNKIVDFDQSVLAFEDDSYDS